MNGWAPRAPLFFVDRIANKAHGHEEAQRWDAEQYARMTPDERRRVAKTLRDRVYGTDCPDVRDAVGGSKRRRRKR